MNIIGISVWIEFGVSVSLRRKVRRTLYDLYCPHFLPEVVVKLIRRIRGHLVIKISMHQLNAILEVSDILTT